MYKPFEKACDRLLNIVFGLGHAHACVNNGSLCLTTNSHGIFEY